MVIMVQKTESFHESYYFPEDREFFIMVITVITFNPTQMYCVSKM